MIATDFQRCIVCGKFLDPAFDTHASISRVTCRLCAISGESREGRRKNSVFRTPDRVGNRCVSISSCDARCLSYRDTYATNITRCRHTSFLRKRVVRADEDGRPGVPLCAFLSQEGKASLYHVTSQHCIKLPTKYHEGCSEELEASHGARHLSQPINCFCLLLGAVHITLVLDSRLLFGFIRKDAHLRLNNVS